jgi:hypothetical protein
MCLAGEDGFGVRRKTLQEIGSLSSWAYAHQVRPLLAVRGPVPVFMFSAGHRERQLTLNRSSPEAQLLRWNSGENSAKATACAVTAGPGRVYTELEWYPWRNAQVEYIDNRREILGGCLLVRGPENRC